MISIAGIDNPFFPKIKITAIYCFTDNNINGCVLILYGTAQEPLYLKLFCNLLNAHHSIDLNKQK